ncbi:hypothetical protein OO012_04815 [Rhodobacteraceae bacterium KMM 6894]|nr:hypothetical protein [Rhodobacteraceae bacterium KMM 6894]
MTYTTKTSARRFVALALAGALAVAAIPASARDQDPTSQVPTWISESTFKSLDANEIYEIDRAQKLGSPVVIEGHTVSESRDLVDGALNSGTIGTQSASVGESDFAAHNEQSGPGNR